MNRLKHHFMVTSTFFLRDVSVGHGLMPVTTEGIIPWHQFFLIAGRIMDFIVPVDFKGTAM